MPSPSISTKAKRVVLTASQHATLGAIRAHIAETGISPTYEEVAVRLSVSKSTARFSIMVLRRKEFLTPAMGSFRNLVITRKGARELARVGRGGVTA